MKRNIKLWGTRVFSLAIVVVAAQHWGMPLYKQYFTPKKTATFHPTAKVKEGAFTVSFHQLGTLEAERSVPVVSETNGKIITLVADGQTVNAGERLVELDVSDLEREVRQKQMALSNAQAEVKKAQAELEILKESNRTEVEQAEAQLQFDENELELAKKELEKRKRLAADRLVPQTDVDRADLEVRSNELAVLKGEKALALKKKEVESKEQQKQADVRNVEYKENIARLDLEEVELRVSKAMIMAPSGGLVVISRDWTPDGRRKLKEGDSVRVRQTICELPDLSSMLVKVQVGEADAPKISIGLPVLIRLDAVPNKVYHGSVSSISNLATEPDRWDTTAATARRNFEVIIAVKEVDPNNIKPGMTADVEFICESIRSAVYVPIEAVHEQNGKTFVFLREGSRYRRVPVVTGKSNDNSICITGGLRKDQIVALRDPTRPLEQQEADSSSADTEKKSKDDKKQPPMPVSAN